MDAIGITQSLVVAPQAAPAIPVQQNNDTATVPAPKESVPASYDAAAAEQARAATVQRLAQQIANVFVLGDSHFSLFKDSTGQYITRFTSLRDGKVTYIPEPTLFKMGSSSGMDTTQLLTIKA